MKKFFIFLFVVFVLAACSGCTSLRMTLDGLEHAEISVSNQSSDSLEEFI